MMVGVSKISSTTKIDQMKKVIVIIELVVFSLLFQNCKSTKPEVGKNDKDENIVQQVVEVPEVVINTTTEIIDSSAIVVDELTATISENPVADTISDIEIPIVKETNTTIVIPEPKNKETTPPKKEVEVKAPTPTPKPVTENKEVYSKPRGAAWKVPAADAKKVSKIKADAANIAAGKEIWVKECKSCHGTKGLGDGTKAEKIEISCGNFSYASFQSQTDGELYYKTKKGRKPMPSFEEKLDDNEVWLLVNYMRTFKK